MELFDLARDVLAEGEVCDHCLGRRFASLSHGLGNDERGRALRVAVALDDDVEFERPEGCWVCDGVFDDVDVWAGRVVEAFEGWGFDGFLVGTRVPPLIEENERLLDEVVGSEHAEEFKREFNREVGRRVEADVDAEVEFERPDVVALLDLASDGVDLQVNPVFYLGRYRKLSRDLPQTNWTCHSCDGTGSVDDVECDVCGGSGSPYDDSVEGYVAPAFLGATEGTEAVFHGAGREDVDARMLGRGRPFVLEVKRPRHRDVDLDAVEREIAEHSDGAVEVTGLRRVEGTAVEEVKRGDADKRYAAYVEFGEAVDAGALDDALSSLAGEVAQRTPWRVEHRRADRTRERRVHEIVGHPIDDVDPDADHDAVDESRYAYVEVEAEGGLYVKELVSGDEGRTSPSLAGLLGVDASVVALDVLDVDLDLDEVSG
ncbi:MAG: tRNA pseudouridine(54/55) synthase Pus10 [Halobacteriales archaeon]